MQPQPLTVSLSVYDVAKPDKSSSRLVTTLNDVMGWVGGCFHGGIVVDNIEWSYGYSPQQETTGVYCVEPQKNPMYRYRESISLGTTLMDRPQVREILLRLRQEWVASEYDLLAHNCCHFCKVLCRELGCKTPPGWLNRFAQSAKVARSLGVRSKALLRSSLAKMSIFPADSKRRTSTDAEDGTRRSDSSSPAINRKGRWSTYPATNQGEQKSGSLAARSSGYPFSSLGVDDGHIDNLFARPAVGLLRSVESSSSREHSLADLPSGSDAETKQQSLPHHAVSAAPDGDSRAKPPITSPSPVHPPQPASSARPSRPEPHKSGGSVLQTMFARPESLVCEEAYLSGSCDGLDRGCLQDSHASSPGSCSGSTPARAESGSGQLELSPLAELSPEAADSKSGGPRAPAGSNYEAGQHARLLLPAG